jgi:hypothetical protein
MTSRLLYQAALRSSSSCSSSTLRQAVQRHFDHADSADDLLLASAAMALNRWRRGNIVPATSGA